ncbi:MAG: winged helix-turn-helix transcriptional regulator [Candidatus Omnitrophica bacterium]|nr:winged helix-turn-helix transcriptional regulator [Candidatus Omnitrophota bacterium]
MTDTEEHKTPANSSAPIPAPIPAHYYDMRLLDAVASSPHLTQRDLSRRIGVALGFTNLLIKRLVVKGYIKIISVKKTRIRYLITPKGIIEKARLTCEYIECSLSFYKDVRVFLRQHVGELARHGQRRILLYGTGELAEIAFLTLQEMGLELVGVVDGCSDRTRFFGHIVRSIGYAVIVECDRVIVTTPRPQADVIQRLVELGVPEEKIIALPPAPMKLVSVSPKDEGGLG